MDEGEEDFDDEGAEDDEDYEYSMDAGSSVG